MTATLMTVTIDDTGRRAVAHLPTRPEVPVGLSGVDEDALMTEVLEYAHAEARATGDTVTLEIADDRATEPDTALVRFEVDPDQNMRTVPTEPAAPIPAPHPAQHRSRRPSTVVRVNDDTASTGRAGREPATRFASVETGAVDEHLDRRPPVQYSRPAASAAPDRAAPGRAAPGRAAPDRAVTVGEGPAQRGLRGRLNAALGLKLAAGTDELGVRSAASAISGPLPDSATVAVVNVKGGVGKTPITLGLASQLAAHRGRGTVAAVDLGEGNNSFADRITTAGTPGFDTLGLLDLHDDHGAVITPAALGRYLIRQPSGEDVLVSRHADPMGTGHPSSDASDGVELGYDDARTLGALLARYRDLLVIDTGNSEAAGRWKWAVTSAQVVLVPVPLRADVLRVARRMVHRIEALRPAGLSGVFVIITDGPGDTPSIEADQIDALIRQDGITTVLRMPYEPVFASGEPITAYRLAPSTRDALTRLGSHVISAMSEGVAMG